ncbi:MAG: SPOR domain-containing protein [Cyclobacteriaceae bacterium]
MADEDKKENEDQDDFFGDDDDFGLPDLEYEALGDDDDKADQPVEEEVTAEAEPEPDPTPEPEPEPSPEPEPEPEPEMADDSIFGDDSFETAPDSTESADSSTGDDLGGDLGDDIYSEEDFGDFDASDIDLDAELSDSVFDGDDFGGEEFKDFESETETAEAASDFEDTPAFSNDDAKASKGKFARIVIFGTILFVGLGLIFWFVYSPEGETKKVAKKEVPKKAPAKKPVAKSPAASTPTETKPAATAANTQTQRPAAQPAVATTPGAINRLEERTGNAYVIIASFVDEDIAMDYANKLASEGKSPSIIPPFGNGLFNRVAIAGFPTIAAATQGIDSFKGEYGEDVWVLKY